MARLSPGILDAWSRGWVGKRRGSVAGPAGIVVRLGLDLGEATSVDNPVEIAYFGNLAFHYQKPKKKKNAK